jgi:hypothetical protein
MPDVDGKFVGLSSNAVAAPADPQRNLFGARLVALV